MQSFINRLFISLVILLPWHSLAINGYLRKIFPLIVIWKEVVILILFLLALNKKLEISTNVLKIFIIFFTLFLLTIHFIFNSTGINAIYSFRIYVLPLLLIFSIYKFSKFIDWNYLAKIFLINASIMALFSIFQQFIIGDALYINAGYPTNSFSEEKLNFAFYIGYGLLQRGAGGFIAPIPYSVFLILGLVIIYSYKQLFTKKTASILSIILSTSLLLTFTRSAIVSYFFIFFIPRIGFFNIKTLKFLTLILFIIVFQYFIVPEDIQSLELKTLTTFWINSTTMKDASSIGHLSSLEDGFELLINNMIYGTGLGTVGPHVSNNSNSYFLIESSILSVCVELGIFTALFVFTAGPLLFFNKKSSSLYLIIIYFSISVLLPLIYYVELILLILIALHIINQSQSENLSKVIKKAETTVI
jgi:hypothetical protein